MMHTQSHTSNFHKALDKWLAVENELSQVLAADIIKYVIKVYLIDLRLLCMMNDVQLLRVLLSDNESHYSRKKLQRCIKVSCILGHIDVIDVFHTISCFPSATDRYLLMDRVFTHREQQEEILEYLDIPNCQLCDVVMFLKKTLLNKNTTLFDQIFQCRKCDVMSSRTYVNELIKTAADQNLPVQLEQLMDVSNCSLETIQYTLLSLLRNGKQACFNRFFRHREKDIIADEYYCKTLVQIACEKNLLSALKQILLSTQHLKSLLNADFLSEMRRYASRNNCIELSRLLSIKH